MNPGDAKYVMFAMWANCTMYLYVLIKISIQINPGDTKNTSLLTHWSLVKHICVTNIGSDNGLSPGRRQAIIWNNAGILLIGPLGTNFSEILIEINTFSFKKIHLKMSSGKWLPFCLSLDVLSYLCLALIGSKPFSQWQHSFHLKVVLALAKLITWFLTKTKWYVYADHVGCIRVKFALCTG